ncbi:hypothetical protein AB0F81_13880 [Actinoplanes sp. NPDC024001]|uniref:hypothetical protein n=1 Tax=Actinoplanes sp. NPDC024001 TaxID=3154598 RepID=UPI0033D38CE6
MHRRKIPIAKIAMLMVASVGLTMAVGPSSTSAAVEASAVPAPCRKNPKLGKICGHTRILIVRYTVVKPCQVQRNYPHNPGGGRKTWTIGPGARIAWRYNITANAAMISDPSMAKFPHWGIVTNSDCIGVTTGQRGHYWRYEKLGSGKKGWVRHETPPVPAGQPMPKVAKQAGYKSYRLYGRSQNEKTQYWNKVDWRPNGATTPTARHKMTHNATLRDRPNEFVIGNVMKGWLVHSTGEKRRGYTKVYVPSLKRWGWLQL